MMEEPVGLGVHMVRLVFLGVFLLGIPVPAATLAAERISLSSMVDLREKEKSVPARTIPANRGPYYPGCELLATRSVLNDLLKAGQLLQNEAWNLDNDASELWDQWRTYVSPRGTSADWIWSGQDKTGSDRRIQEETHQSEAFNFYGRVQRLNRRVQKNFKDLGKAEKLWWKGREALSREVRRDGDGTSVQKPLDRLKTRLASLARAFSAADGEIQSFQEEYDYVRPAVLGYLNKIAPAPPYLEGPWHWNYAISETPRVEFRYNFEERFKEYWDQSHRDLHTGKNRGNGRK